MSIDGMLKRRGFTYDSDLRVWSNGKYMISELAAKLYKGNLADLLDDMDREHVD